MRYATIRTPDGTTAARLEGDELVPLEATDVGSLLASGSPESIRSRSGTSAIPLDGADFAPLVPFPSKVFCVGLNYREHILETGRELPQFPTLFAKFADTLIGANDDIALPAVSERPDWEVELCVVVGKELHRASEDEAAAAIAGYSVLNDISMRDWQHRTEQWLQGKAFEKTTPVGPFLVTPDEIDHAADLALQCTVDGEVMQSSRTSDLLFKPAAIVAYASQVVTLRPGDLFATGTPGGVGAARKPPVYLRPGQTVRAEIEGIGACVNTCRAEKVG